MRPCIRWRANTLDIDSKQLSAQQHISWFAWLVLRVVAGYDRMEMHSSDRAELLRFQMQRTCSILRIDGEMKCHISLTAWARSPAH